MNGKPSGFKERPACSTKYDLFLLSMQCKVCGSEVEIWADEDEAVCSGCGERITNKVKG